MKQIALDIGLHSAPSFANFLVGPNAGVLQHLKLWAAAASRSPVPCYLWGASASGKTHLLQSAVAALKSQGLAVGWLDASMYEPPAYQEAWSAVVMDDVHLYTAVQQHAAFNWFVNAQTHQHWVLAAGDTAPAGLKLREDLRTRLGWGHGFEVLQLGEPGWGHVFGLQVMSEPERRAVLRQEADARGVFLSDEVMDFILKRFSRDLGSLMQLLDQLDGYALQTQRAITIPLVKSMLDSQ
jgi:DnaA-homolog protein